MSLRSRLLKIVPAGIAALAMTAALAAPASAVSPAKIYGSGSDTTYGMMQKLDALYNGSVGCVVIGSPQKLNNSCYADTADTILTEDYAHDVVSEFYPLGSSNGITQLATQGTTGTAAINFARSSRGPATTDLAGLRFVAYARDAISWWTANTNTHTPGDNTLSQAEVQGIWNTCTKTQWGQVDHPATADATPILVYAAQSGSGTRKTFDGFLGSGANSTNCIPASQKDGNVGNGERVIFENNAQPIYDQNEDTSAIFYYSFGRFDQNGGQNGTLGKIDGIAPTATTIGNNTFPYGRFLFNVYRATTSTKVATAQTKKYVSEVNGWLCKQSGAHATNPFTGNNYRTDIENVIKSEGFVPIPAGAVGGGLVGTSHCRVVTA